MNLDDLSFRLFDQIARGVGLAGLFGLGALLALAGLIVLARRGTAWAGFGLLCLGAASASLGLLTVSEHQAEVRLAEMIRARSYVHGDGAREVAQVGLLLVPALVVLVKLGRDRVEHDRRRSLLSTYLRIATNAYYKGDVDRAIAEYSIAIKVDPARIESYVRRGQARMQKGEYDRALADFDRALTIDPDLAAAHLNRGIVLAARGDHDAAIVDFERAHGLSPRDAAPLLHRGISLAKIGDPIRAADDFRRILRITNHSDFTEPARFHLAVLDGEHPTLAVMVVAS